MKKLLALVVFVVIVGVAANYLIKGGLPFMKSLSGEEQQVNSLRSELRAAQQEYRQAGRAAGMTGMDTTADASAILAKVDRIETKVKNLKTTLKSDVAQRAAQALEDEISDFKRELH